VNYLLVNHIPAHVGRDASHVHLPRAWARDLAAAARAASGAGARLLVATPLSDAPAPRDAIELVPDENGFEHVPLPHYSSARSFLRERAKLTAQLELAVSAADVVQLDLGGHPVPLGLVADPLARAAGKPTIWMTAGERAPDLRLASESRSATKRAVGRTLDTRVRRSLSDALREAGAVITTHAEASAELDRSGIASTTIESVAVADAEVATDPQTAARHARLLDGSRPLRILVTGEHTIDRGTEHVLAAMFRCWRLRVPVTLVTTSRGSESDAVRQHARELGLTSHVTLIDPVPLDEADLIIDPALGNAARLDLELFLARGLPAIAYSPRSAAPAILSLPRGDVDALADALFRAATDRAALAARMISGHAWVRARTIDAAHRQRFALARTLARTTARGAA
jgi:hypothetical protein